VELKCRVCGAPFRVEDLDAALRVARCGHCETLTDLAARRGDVAADGGAPAPRARVPLPERFEVSDGAGALEISWRWLQPVHYFLAFFSVAWNAFLVLWFTMSLLTGPLFILMWLFAAAHVAAGVAMAYTALAGFKNSTHLHVGGGFLRVRHSPIPWRGDLDLPVAEIEQLYVKEKITRGKNGERRSYALRAVAAGGRDATVLTGLSEDAQALWLEQAIEERLGISDRPVAGGWRGAP